MGTIGVFTGKFLPLHTGHIYSIEIASKKCDKLYVIICHDQKFTEKECKDNNLPFMGPDIRKKWIESNMSHISNMEVLILDQTSFAPFPDGMNDFSSAIKKLVKGKIDYFFGGEPKMIKYAKEAFNAEYIVIDNKREAFAISATEIRKDLNKNKKFLKKNTYEYLNKEH